MANELLLSVGLPVYNGEKYIRQTLDSLLSQQFGEFELIISDNASTDGTQAICQEFVLKDKRVKYYRSETNQGAAWNFNNVYYKASGEYFMWAAHDDYWEPQYLKTCLGVLKDSPFVVLAGSACNCTDPKTTASLFTDPGLNTVGLKPSQRFKQYKIIVRDPRNSNALFYGIYRRKALSKMMPLKKVFANDHIIMAGLTLVGEFVTVPEVEMTKRGGGASVSLERVAKITPITNPFLIKYPHLVREFLLQGMILKSDQLTVLDKAVLSWWSMSDFLKCSFSNRTKIICNKIKP